MNVTEIVLIIGCIFSVLGSVVTVVWVISHKVSYSYANATFQRKDLHVQEYNTLIDKIDELKIAIEEIKNRG